MYRIFFLILTILGGGAFAQDTDHMWPSGRNSSGHPVHSSHALDDIAGMGGVTGSGVAGQLAFWSSVSHIIGDTKARYDATHHGVILGDGPLDSRSQAGSAEERVNLLIRDDSATTTTQGVHVIIEAFGKVGYAGFARSRGTQASPLVNQAGDNLGEYGFAGYQDSNGGNPNFMNAGKIRASATASASANLQPADLHIIPPTSLNATVLEKKVRMPDLAGVATGKVAKCVNGATGEVEWQDESGGGLDGSIGADQIAFGTGVDTVGGSDNFTRDPVTGETLFSDGTTTFTVSLPGAGTALLSAANAVGIFPALLLPLTEHSVPFIGSGGVVTEDANLSGNGMGYYPVFHLLSVIKNTADNEPALEIGNNSTGAGSSNAALFHATGAAAIQAEVSSGVTTGNFAAVRIGLPSGNDGTTDFIRCNLAGTGDVFIVHQDGSLTVPNGTLYGALPGTATLDFGNTLAGASTDLTIAVTGAVDGDVVTVGVPIASQTANGVYSAFVSASDVVTVRFTNTNLVTAINPTSGAFKVLVTHF
jgi:hypothetical protein